MGISKLIQIAAILAVAAVTTGKSSAIVRNIQVLKLKLIKCSLSSNWGVPPLLDDGR